MFLGYSFLTQHLQALARLGAQTTAIDASSSSIAIATTHATADPELTGPRRGPEFGTLRYIHTSAETLVQEPQRYDVVCSMEVIEHVDNPAQFLQTCADLVKVRSSFIRRWAPH